MLKRKNVNTVRINTLTMTHPMIYIMVWRDNMIKSKKRTCDRCKALWYDANVNAGVCVLDHKILDIGGYEPLEACKKPKTKQELLECLREVGKVVPV